jgi:hypothetical protein
MMDITGIGSVLDFGSKIIDRIWPNPAERDAAKLELFKAQQAGEFKAMDQAFELAKGQIGVNSVEAASFSIFVAGWRPFIGWTCGAAFAYKFVLAPAAAFALTAFGHPIELPVLDFTEMSTVLLGMLGIGALRTVEKVKGVA